MYLGLRKSVSATRGNHTGLAKPGQMSQVKQIQPKTEYTCKKVPNFIPREQSCYTIVRALSFILSRSLLCSNCLKPVNGKKFTCPKIRLFSEFDLTDSLSREFICFMFYHP